MGDVATVHGGIDVEATSTWLGGTRSTRMIRGLTHAVPAQTTFEIS